jgi:hypothetical protein
LRLEKKARGGGEKFIAIYFYLPYSPFAPEQITSKNQSV